MQLSWTLMSASLAALLVLSTQLHRVSGQAYHFSKGWAAGKRAADGHDGRPTAEYRPAGESATLEALGRRVQAYIRQRTTAQCNVESGVTDIIEQLIKLEALRLASCHLNAMESQDDYSTFLNWFKTKLQSPSSAQQQK